MVYQATGIILAGGKSSRMGRDKALILLKNRTFLEHSITKMKELFQEVLVVSDKSNKYQVSNIKQVVDIYPGCGPLGGIHAGLYTSEFEWVMVTACDMPCWDRKIIDELMKLRPGYDAVVPEVKNKPEPLFSLYNKSCLPVIEQLLKQKSLKVTDLFSKIHTKKVDIQNLGKNIFPEEFININTPEDMAKYKDFLIKNL